MKTLTLKTTGWMHYVLTVLLAVVTISLFHGYSDIHWNVLPQGEATEESWRLLAFFSAYHWTGLLTFIVSLLSPFCKPRWLAIISIPIGLIALRLSLLVMKMLPNTACT